MPCAGKARPFPTRWTSRRSLANYAGMPKECRSSGQLPEPLSKKQARLVSLVVHKDAATDLPLIDRIPTSQSHMY